MTLVLVVVVVLLVLLLPPAVPPGLGQPEVLLGVPVAHLPVAGAQHPGLDHGGVGHPVAGGGGGAVGLVDVGARVEDGHGDVVRALGEQVGGGAVAGDAGAGAEVPEMRENVGNTLFEIC